MLPLDRKKVNKIFISGPVANSQTILGDWALLQPEENVWTVYKGIQEIYSDAIVDTLFFSNNIVGMNSQWIEEAEKKALEADVNIVVVGENSLRYDRNRTCRENKDRDNLDSPGKQQELLEAVYKSGKPTILVLLNGRPLSVTWADKNIPAILEAWEPGSFGGIAIAEILFGDVNPSGKLPITFPHNVGQIQTVYNHKSSQYARTFVLSPTGALYPFGYGLSYTDFTYGEPKIEKTNYKIGETIQIEVPVTNTGDREGSEIVQLYIRGLYGSVTRPVKELKEFSREENIQPGETRKVQFTLAPEIFRCFSANNKWEVEPGKYYIMVGSSSRNKDLQTIEIQLTE
ncbi:MAG: glycoside hydrolase family 3 C-terminal domain-containing protein [Odoribacter sp.]|nr:glycoside hydrolase family 3 C-terminal domain-containing protein [Odoribacter sp.]